MRHQKFVITFLVVVFVIGTLPVGSEPNAILDSEGVAGTFDLDRTISVDIIVTDYVNDPNFNAGIIDQLPTSLSVEAGVFDPTYALDYNLIYPSVSFNDQLNSFVDSISSTALTSKLDSSALKYQSANYLTQDIFLEQNGTAIEGQSLEDWLWSKVPEVAPTSSYQIFLMNFSRFDTSSDKHWFEIPEVDPSTGLQRDFWRLEWDIPPTPSVNNFDAKFPYPGWSEDYPMYFLDPTAHNWYLEWTTVWRGVPEDSAHAHYFDTFSDYVKSLGGMTSPSRTYTAGKYVGQWLDEIVRNVFFLQPIAAPRSPQSLAVQVAAFTDDSPSNPYPDLNWTINETIIEQELGPLLPVTNITVEVDWYRLSDTPAVQSTLDANEDVIFEGKPDPIPNYNYYDGYSLFSDMMGHDGEFFEDPGTELTVRAYVFVMDNVSFASPGLWGGGGLFTGLGGGGRVLIMNEVDRIFYNRTTDPVRKSSLSKVFVHEAGHAVGLPHPFTSGAYASDFLGEVMGYYPSTESYSKCFLIAYNRYILDKEIHYLSQDLKSLAGFQAVGYYNELKIIFGLLQEAYLEWDFENVRLLLSDLDYYYDLVMNAEEEGGISAPLVLTQPNSTLITDLDSEVSFQWVVVDQNPSRYTISINGTEVATALWDNDNPITYNTSFDTAGTYVLTIVIADGFNEKFIQDVFITVEGSVTTTTTTSGQSPTSSSSEEEKTGSETTPFDGLMVTVGLLIIAGVVVVRQQRTEDL